MQNPIQKFRQSSIIFEKPGILCENLRTSTHSFFIFLLITQDLKKIKKIPGTLL